MTMRTRIMIGILIVVVGAVLYGVQQYFKPHATIGKPTVFISANEIAKVFEADETDANKKFVGTDQEMRIIQVAGKISELVTDSIGTTVALETENPMHGVRCTLDKFSKATDKKLVVGDSIILKGLCTGYLSDVIFDRCIVVK